MIRPPRSASGFLRSSNGARMIELASDADLASLEVGAEVEVLVWDRSSASVLDRIAHTQQISIEDAAHGLRSRGALHAEHAGLAGNEASALFLSRLASFA